MSNIDMTIESSTVVTATHQSAETRFRDADGVGSRFAASVAAVRRRW